MGNSEEFNKTPTTQETVYPSMKTNGINTFTTVIDGYPQKHNGTGNKENGNVEFEKNETPYVWKNVIFFIVLHILGIYGFCRGIAMGAYSFLFFHYIYLYIGGFGITAGAHRLWAHRAYKAKFPLRVLLALLNCIAGQNCLYVWIRDHRAHHKFSDTNADPHSATRGFFFSHVGWLLRKRHPEVKAKGKLIYMKDIEDDFVVAWQRKYYYYLVFLVSIVLPITISKYFFGVDILTAFLAVIWRWTLSLNLTWLINSAAHKWGNKPYDRNIKPGESIIIAALVLGEGWHNYHHIFPFDYKTAELGDYSFNVTNAFIDFFALIGWAYDLKTVSDETLRKRIQRTGDGTHKKYGNKIMEGVNQYHGNIWGWGDEDLAPEDMKDVTIIKRKLG